MGNIHYARGDLPEAREAYEAALEISREQGSVLRSGGIAREPGPGAF